MQRNDLIVVTRLSNLFPLYTFAVREIANEHSMINETRFRDVIIGLANNKAYFPQVNLFVKEVNEKVIKANNLEYLKRFKKLWENLQPSSTKRVTKKVPEKVTKKVAEKKVKKKANSDDDVDDKADDISL